MVCWRLFVFVLVLVGGLNGEKSALYKMAVYTTAVHDACPLEQLVVDLIMTLLLL